MISELTPNVVGVGSKALLAAPASDELEALACDFEAETGERAWKYREATTPEGRAEGLAADIDFYRRHTEGMVYRMTHRIRRLAANAQLRDGVSRSL